MSVHELTLRASQRAFPPHDKSALVQGLEALHILHNYTHNRYVNNHLVIRVLLSDKRAH